MNSFELLELLAVILIILIQVFIFLRTNSKIRRYKSIFPDSDNFKIIRPIVGKPFFILHPQQILSNLPKLIQIAEENEKAVLEARESAVEATNSENDVQLDLIIKKEGGNAVTDKIIYSLNTYLIRNKGVASDFHLIKDVVERNCDSLEEDISQTVSVPLYLGLLGTFLGIITGLVQISGMNYGENGTGLDSAISVLLKGVQIAMFASFTGLLLTVLNSTLFFKGAKAKLEEKKNDFYTFIQTDLLPLLNQNINSTLFSLQSNLHKFNEEFKGNVHRLSAVMGKNHDALIAQEKILTTLDNMDITEFAKANVVILRELQFSTDKFSEFNQYLASLTGMMNNSQRFVAKINEMIDRTNNFELLGKQIISVFEENKELNKFLQHHYTSLDESHQLISQAVNNVGNTLDESLDNLKTFTQERINEVQKITLREIDLMQNQYPEKWKKLDNLIHLEEVNKNIRDIKLSNASQIGSLNNEVKELNASLLRAITELEAIKNKNSRTLSSRIKSIFKRKKRKSKNKNEVG